MQPTSGDLVVVIDDQIQASLEEINHAPQGSDLMPSSHWCLQVSLLPKSCGRPVAWSDRLLYGLAHL